MERLRQYILQLLGKDIQTIPFHKKELAGLPYYVNATFDFYRTHFYGTDLLLLYLKDNDFQVGQIKKQIEIVAKIHDEKLVLVADTIHPMSKKRLMESGIHFIIPGKQLFLPGLLMDIREDLLKIGYHRRSEKLAPSAQFILLYKILYRYEKIEQLTFKELAKKMGYTAMAITKAVATIEELKLCIVEGTKEKHIYFKNNIPELWQDALPYFTSPILKKVFVDKLPNNSLLHSNVLALAKYTDMAPGNQDYYAIDKTSFYTLIKNNALLNPNEFDGPYCLEIWKYNPTALAKGISGENNVDPLSLYLCFKDVQDERIEIALDQIIEKYIW